MEGFHITKFSKGDLITKCKLPTITKVDDNLGIAVNVTVNVTYGADTMPFELVAIENNCIYLWRTDFKVRGVKQITVLNYDIWQDDWIDVIIPEGLTLKDIS